LSKFKIRLLLIEVDVAGGGRVQPGGGQEAAGGGQETEITGM
jgi:hypothetical protein